MWLFFLFGLRWECLLLGGGFFGSFLPSLGALGPQFCTLLKHLRSDQFQHGGIGAVSASPSGPYDASVPAVARIIPLGDIVKELLHRLCAQAVTCRKPPGMEIATLTESNHAFGRNPRLFGLGKRCFNPFVNNQRSHQVPQKRAPVLSISAEFSPVIEMAHF